MCSISTVLVKTKCLCMFEPQNENCAISVIPLLSSMLLFFHLNLALYNKTVNSEIKYFLFRMALSSSKCTMINQTYYERKDKTLYFRIFNGTFPQLTEQGAQHNFYFAPHPTNYVAFPGSTITTIKASNHGSSLMV